MRLKIREKEAVVNRQPAAENTDCDEGRKFVDETKFQNLISKY
jgi:hypothetical protein